MTQSTLTPTLHELLRQWLPSQRWFPVKAGAFSLVPVGGFTLTDSSGEAGLEVILASVVSQTADGGARTDVVQVPLSYRSAPLAGAGRALIGEIDDAELVRSWIYDGVHDPVFVAEWLDLMRTEGVAAGGAASGHLPGGGQPLPSAAGTVRVLSGEQSNTSVIVDDGASAAIVKFFRVLSAGRNPEVEVGAALSAARTSEVPATLGWVTGQWLPQQAAAGTDSGQDAAVAGPVQGELAVAHEFLAGGRDAWRLAVDAAAAGTDFTQEAHALGHATATVHRRLAETLGVSAEAVPGGVIAPGVAQRVRQAWTEAGPAVGPYENELDSLLMQLEGTPAGALQRIHGDLHLGQILQVPGRNGGPDRWAILDFEGEPMRPISERNFPDVPLRDVVGMLRSFD